jgi:hypothetical protein
MAYVNERQLSVMKKAKGGENRRKPSMKYLANRRRKYQSISKMQWRRPENGVEERLKAKKLNIGRLCQ